MFRLRWKIAIFGLLVCTCGGLAPADEYSDPSGFSFTYPDGWFAANGLEKLPFPPDLQQWLDKSKIDWSRVKVVAVHVNLEDFSENVNVVVENQQIAVDAPTVRQLTTMLTQKFKESPIKVEDVQGRVQKIGPRDAVVIDFNSQFPGVPNPLRQRQVYLPGGGNTYIITCTAKADSFENTLPAFDAIVASFKAPAPVVPRAQPPFKVGIDWAGAVIGAGLGGTIAGMIVIVRLFTGKKKPASSEGKDA